MSIKGNILPEIWKLVGKKILSFSISSPWVFTFPCLNFSLRNMAMVFCGIICCEIERSPKSNPGIISKHPSVIWTHKTFRPVKTLLQIIHFMSKTKCQTQHSNCFKTLIFQFLLTWYCLYGCWSPLTWPIKAADANNTWNNSHEISVK